MSEMGAQLSFGPPAQNEGSIMSTHHPKATNRAPLQGKQQRRRSRIEWILMVLGIVYTATLLSSLLHHHNHHDQEQLLLLQQQQQRQRRSPPLRLRPRPMIATTTSGNYPDKQQKSGPPLNPPPTTFLLGIFCTMSDVAKRRLIRETMLNHKYWPEEMKKKTSTNLQVVCTLQEYLQQQAQDSSSRPNKCQIAYTFVVGGNPMMDEEWISDDEASSSTTVLSMAADGTPTPIEKHSESLITMDPTKMLKHEHDIVYLNIHENMNDGKTPTWFRYATTMLTTTTGPITDEETSSSSSSPPPQKVQFDYISKADIDTLIHMPSLLHYVNTDLTYQRATVSPPSSFAGNAVYGGYLNEYEACGGGGSALCDEFVRGKVYMSGQFYWLGWDVAYWVVQESKLRRRRPVLLNSATKTAIFSTEDSALRLPPFVESHNEDLDMGLKVLTYPSPIHLMACNGAMFWRHPLKTEDAWMNAFRDMTSSSSSSSSFSINDHHRHQQQQQKQSSLAIGGSKSNTAMLWSESKWLGPSFYEQTSKTIMSSVLGRVMNPDRVPILLD